MAPDPQPAPIVTPRQILIGFALAGLVSRDGVMIDDMAPVATSFPTFVPLLRTLGALA